MSETELVVRLERLERAHRRLKGFALAALGLATALATIYATQPVPRTITAHRFEVVDDAGKMQVELGLDRWGTAFIGVHDAGSKGGAFMGVGASGDPYITLTEFNAKGLVRMDVNSSGSPVIGLSDAQGFRMDLGSTTTVKAKTGATEQTSAASIVMFGNDEKHRVIWQAP